MKLDRVAWVKMLQSIMNCRALVVGGAITLAGAAFAPAAPVRHTAVGISGGDFVINGKPTLEGRVWNSVRIEGLLPNARLVQGVFDDLNPATRSNWAYPDTKRWDPDRNTREFVAAMPDWRRHGLLAFTLNLQGGSPLGYGNHGWINSAFRADGSLRDEYMQRAQRILDRADRLGMVVILGLYYFGQDQQLADETAVRAGVKNVADWLFDHGYSNVLLEIDNECTEGYHHAILRENRVAELVAFAQSLRRDGRRLLCSVSYSGGKTPTPQLAAACDFILLHGNGVTEPDRICEMIRTTRALPGAETKPIVFNEDDHFGFDQPKNDFVIATRAHVSWGFFDYRMNGEPYSSGFQSVPVDWQIDSPRKRGFFDLLAKITGSD